ncbi:hypothetical protein ID866_4510 [Astraeus odoratus]|nr:hypothetical protein ID866_4510 [Astraeus odoratus]
MFSSPNIDLRVVRPFYRKQETPEALPSIASHGIALYSPEAAATLTVPPKSSAFNQLFYDPAPPPSLICPQRWAGIDPESTEMLVRTLVHNHVTWHIFFNYQEFHNHASHHLLAIWAMGACGPIIEATYAQHWEYQRPVFESPGRITHSNFYEHLGDETYYSAYLAFFSSELLTKGISECLEEYLLSVAVNFAHPGDDDKEQPSMLSRFVAGVVHPFIHVGYGTEFGLLGISAEGLAMTAVHPPVPGLLDRLWFQDVMSKPDNESNSRSALTILSLVACDTRFSNVKEVESGALFSTAVKEYGSMIREYVETWKFDVTSNTGVADAVEELSWVTSVIYGVSGHISNQRFNADFFLMHLLTSSLFLPSLLSQTSKFSSRRALLLTYFTTSLVLYVARGRPKLDVRAFYQGTEHLLHNVPGASTSPAAGTLPEPSSGHAQTPNTWLPLIQSTLVHPNEHLCKAQRALAHYSSLYGTRRKGWTTGLSMPEGRTTSPAEVAMEEKVESKVGMKDLDGTLFLRIAMLTQNRAAWMREGEREGGWDFHGFYDPHDA